MLAVLADYAAMVLSTQERCSHKEQHLVHMRDLHIASHALLRVRSPDLRKIANQHNGTLTCAQAVYMRGKPTDIQRYVVQLSLIHISEPTRPY